MLYGEGLFVGYRGYDETDRAPMFSFGQGLSYSSFEWSPIELVSFHQPKSAQEISVQVQVAVTNASDRPGSEVIQIYVSDPVCSYRRPLKELKGFAKVFLNPGETRTVLVKLDKLALSFYNDVQKCWVAEEGDFIITAAQSARTEDQKSHVEIYLERTLTWTGL